MNAFPGAPRTLVGLLGLLLAIKLVTTFLPPIEIGALMGLALLAYLSWTALQGKFNSARVLAVFLLLFGGLGLFSILQLLTAGGMMLATIVGFTPFLALLTLVISILQVSTAVYIFRSKEVKAFYADQERFRI